MKVLFVAGACPYPPDSGGTVRTYNLLKRLSARYEITLVAPEKRAVDLRKAFESALADAITVPVPRRTAARIAKSLLSPLPYIVQAHSNPAMNAAVRDALASGGFDLVHCDSISVAPAVPRHAPIPKVFNAHNVEAVIWERYVGNERRPWMVPILRSQLAKIARFESTLPSLFDWYVTVSEQDRDQMRRRYQASDVVVVPNGVDLDYYAPLADPEEPALAFVGSLDWRPNQDGVRWLIRSIWPRIKSERPDARLSIVGRRPPGWIRKLCRESGVSLHADVPDTRPHLACAAVIVVPLRIGGGSRLKILEAMAAGRCVVSTTIGAEGLDARGGEHLVIADDPAPFAQQCVSLLYDPARRQAISRLARALVETRYGWDKAALELERAWAQTQAALTLPTSGLGLRGCIA
jgi:sugar transferase (PEP-CTERM/EpsH1 system associated)